MAALSIATHQPLDAILQAPTAWHEDLVAGLKATRPRKKGEKDKPEQRAATRLETDRLAEMRRLMYGK